MALDEVTREILRNVGTATLTTQLFKRGLRSTFMTGVRPLHRLARHMVGEAVTLRFIPAREDLDTFESLASRDHPQRKAIETVPSGAVLVVDCRAERGAAAVGDILVARMKVRGAEGVVTDGGIRDVASAAEQGLPVYCAGPAAPPSIARHHAADANVPIACGGVAVYPGDVIVGDADGVVVIPARFAKEVAAAAAEQDRLETFLLREIQSGRPLFGTYPPDEDTIGRYRDTQES